ncbi:MAG TPA: GDSL-type esterase/lipase family protein [Acidimicrobiales bacterium]|nr:GDSL-type esterase/lipase family protein [Acidimicrobiales bacterium]
MRVRWAVVGVIALVGAVALGVAPGPAGADSTTPVTNGFYLALGASESLGWQPTLAAPDGQRTDQGYANDLVAFEAARGVHLDLTQLGCPGENTATMISGADRCYRSSGSQLASAVAFLEAHRGEPGIVTLDMGFNNVMSCMRDGVVDSTCVSAHLAVVRTELAYIVTTLKAAAGPDVTFVGLSHYDPFAAATVAHVGGFGYAHHSDSAIYQLNQVADEVFAQYGLRVADVAAVFHVSRVTGRRARVTTSRVDSVCDFTWMCQPSPLGPNLHPNAAGYAAIAGAIEAVLGPPWE